MGIVLFIILILRVDTDSVKNHLSKYRLDQILVLISLTIVFVIIKSVRWWFLLIQYGIRVPFFKSSTIYLSGMYLGLVTPGRVGDLTKAFYLKSSNQIPIMQGTLITITDRVLDLIVMLTIAFFFILLGILNLNIYISFLISLLIILLLYLSLRYKNRLKNGSLRIIRVIFKEKISTQSLENLRFYPLNINMLFTYISTLVAFFLLILQAYLISYYIGLKISFFYTGGAIISANVITLLPISIMGVGTREAALLLFIPYFSQELIISFSISFLIFSNIVSTIAGFFCWLYLHFIDKRSIKSENYEPG